MRSWPRDSTLLLAGERGEIAVRSSLVMAGLAVRDCVVVGLPDEKWGERAVADDLSLDVVAPKLI